MPSFQITIAPHRRAAARFISTVRRELQKAFAEEKAKRGLNQSAIARLLGVHRTVIHRELRGDANLTLGRVAEIAFALGRQPEFTLKEIGIADGQNVAPTQRLTATETSSATSTTLRDTGGRFVTLSNAAA